MSSKTSLPLIQVNTPERLRKANSLPKDILNLLNQVKQLREDTDNLLCLCKQPDCPFQESHLIDIQQIECSFDLNAPVRIRRNGVSRNIHPADLKVVPSLQGIMRRGDGTIVEKDGPRTISFEHSLENRLRKSHVSGYHGAMLSVSTLSDSQDCLVDNENLYGTTSSDDDSAFSRVDPRRRQVRRSPIIHKRRATVVAATTPTQGDLPDFRKTSVDTEKNRFSIHLKLRGAKSLPSCASFEADEESLSTCSSSSSLSNSLTNFGRQGSLELVTP